MSATGLFVFIGGIGLFLLGMRLMTDGLKVAAGDGLRRILTSATRSRLRGLASGVLITTLVQSSSAVIFATIGFVNAGLLTLYQAIGVIYGSNLGTTLTSWIVALLGFNVNLQAFAMPAIGLGMTVWVLFGRGQRAALGQALAGLGLFFLGIDVLREGFAGAGDAIQLEALTGYGLLSSLLFVLIGATLTLLMQSSSAALAVTLTAAAGGLIPLPAAAATVIGANVGTTSTAAFAVLGATAAAKRAASAHVAFNVITALVAISLLPLLLWLVAEIADRVAVSGQIAIQLAIFHTMTKLLGIVVMWPLTGWLVKQLEARFRSREEDESRPRHLDHNLRDTPSLALDAMRMELQRLNHYSVDLARASLSAGPESLSKMESGHRTVESLAIAIGEFAGAVHHDEQSDHLGNSLPDGLRASQYLVDAVEHSVELTRLHARVELQDEELVAERARLFAEAEQLFSAALISDEQDSVAALKSLAELQSRFETDYQALKSRLLRAGTTARLPVRRMTLVLEQLSALHRMVDQLCKAARRLHGLKPVQEPAAAPESDAATG